MNRNPYPWNLRRAYARRHLRLFGDAPPALKRKLKQKAKQWPLQ